MRCAFSDELWRTDLNTGDPRVAAHLASCAACRAEVAKLEALQEMLAALPEVDASDAVAARMQQTATVFAGELSCTEAQDLLEAYREGELDAAQTFLMDDHLLWCPTCAAALAQADRLETLLGTLPELDAPAAIAERIAIARQPWWQRLLPPAPQWGYAFAVAAVMLVALVAVPRLGGKQVAHHVPDPKPTPVAPVQPAPADPTPRIAIPDVPAPVAPAATDPVTVAEIDPANIPVQPAAVMPAPVTPADKPMAATAPRPAPGLLVRDVPNSRRRTEETVRTARPEAPRPAESASPEYIASARESMLRMARDAELASIEESLSNAPEVLVASTARRRPDAAPAAAPAASATDPHAVRAEELRKAIIEDLRRRSTPTEPRPIVIRNGNHDTRAEGVLLTIQ